MTCGDSQTNLERVDEDDVFGVMTAFYHKSKLVNVTDPKYLGKVQKWYSRKKRRKIKLKFFYLRTRIKKLFSKKDKK
jgi:hypothetical protein